MIPADTLLPRDHIVLTPWFRVDDSVTNLQPMAIALYDVFVKASSGWIGSNNYGFVKLYEHKGEGVDAGPPVTDIQMYTEATLATSTGPREIALCLSFYANQNQKRRRGRLYLPMTIRPSSVNAEWQTARPGAGVRAKALALGAALSAVGGAGVTWCIYSRVDHTSYPVTNVWVDDEWDTQRRRGTRPTTRDTATVTG